MVDQYIFCSQHAREYRTLSLALDNRTTFVSRRLDYFPAATLLSRLADDAANEVLADTGGYPDAVGHPVPVTFSVHEIQQYLGIPGELRSIVGDERYPCWIWQLPVNYTGAEDIFGCWPDKYDEGLTTFDNGPTFGKPPQTKWQFGDSGRLFATMYVPRVGDRFSPEASTHPRVLLEDAVAHLERYCSAVNRQLADWEEGLRDEVVAHLTQLKDAVTRGRTSRDSVNELLQQWRVPEIEVAAPGPGESRPRAEAPIISTEDRVVLPAPLADASLADIVKVTNRWVQSVEKYPAAFLKLEEERISDLLTATLNGAFARAEREVFVGRGKSDFHVSSNTLGSDGTADAFVGEVKYWSGHLGLLDAVGQALDNLVRRTLTAVLVVLVKDRESYTQAVATGEDTMARIEGSKLDGTIAARSRYFLPSTTDPRRMVSLVVIFVDLCRTDDRLPKPRRGGRGRARAT